MKRSRLNPMSAKRRAALPTRAAVRAEVLERANHACEFFYYLHDAMFQAGVKVVGYPDRCSGPLDVHEIIPRSAWAGGWLVPSNCVALCRHAHHQWVTDNPSAAHSIGLHGFSYERPRET